MPDENKNIDKEVFEKKLTAPAENQDNSLDFLTSVQKPEQAPINLESPLETAPQAEFGKKLPETLTTVEKKEEKGFLEETIKGLTDKLRRTKKKPTVVPQIRDQVTIQIEKMMEDGLEEAFKELTPIEQQQFKIKGEETAWEIRQLLKQTHIQVKKIFRLILQWLKMLPGINHFFLEQEAKIKTDKIIALKYFDKQ